MLNGKRIKVALISELNAGILKNNAESENNVLNRNSRMIEIKKREPSFERRMNIDGDDNKLPISSRIKKNH